MGRARAGCELTVTSERLPAEQKWYALTGRVVDAKLKRTAIFTLRFKMLTARTPELSAPKFLLAPTFTHALLPGSPAIDAGDPNFMPPPFNDQHGPGFPRVVNGRIDKGSFEVQIVATPTPTPTATATPTATTTATPRATPTPRSRPTPAPRP